MDILERIKQIQNVEKFQQELMDVKSAEEVLAVLKNHGVEATIAEVEAMLAQASQQKEELSEDDLETVAGGYIRPWSIPLVKWLIKKIFG